MQRKRLFGLDVFKGWAILLMIAYHTVFDLNYFHFISININKDIFWVNFRYLIVSMFLVSVGISMYLVHYPAIHWNKIYKRTLILGSASCLISIATYLVFPHSWVYFGILHFILVASWIGLLFLQHPLLSLMTAISILIGSAMGWLQMHWLFQILKTPLHLPPHYTEDLLQPFPWFAAILIGITLSYYAYPIKIFHYSFFASQNSFNKTLAFLGRHALTLYLIHLPLLFYCFMLIYKIITP
ncbi:Mlr1315 protein [hydrothermal vent metagenome]|uniref:Mlr1315 protein n=1 Tax=hydrothermal vent metagenome TaxID=652676 RepID=A0A1W1CW02_9ZZZZ